MIVVFEGPRCSGKSTISRNLVDHLKTDGLPAEWWKSERGKDPFTDMTKTIYSDFEDRTKIWVVDRFHLTEYVNSFIKEREHLEDLRGEVEYIDHLLFTRDALLVGLRTSTNERVKRLRAEGREEPRPASVMEDLWIDALQKSRCERIILCNEYPTDRDIIQNLLFDLVKARWNRRT